MGISKVALRVCGILVAGPSARFSRVCGFRSFQTVPSMEKRTRPVWVSPTPSCDTVLPDLKIFNSLSQQKVFSDNMILCLCRKILFQKVARELDGTLAVRLCTTFPIWATREHT
ncbi:hypothetical protein P879_00927 [Paragonimus westermani]|uniref:Uncharacterized protein n=1 Tax=Paragonimus westermani TaxID=34504 RepID=A0A8T0DP60_9TREM|nr:hypothetical protein P879_00927 [Paragonimus westermani]